MGFEVVGSELMHLGLNMGLCEHTWSSLVYESYVSCTYIGPAEK